MSCLSSKHCTRVLICARSSTALRAYRIHGLLQRANFLYGARGTSMNHPFDTPLSSGLRFLVEVIAWVAGPWMASQWSAWLIAPTIVVLVGLPAVFSTPGDKNQIIVSTPGPARVVIEVLLHTASALAPWWVWPDWLAIVSGVIVVAALATGIPRTRWLWRGAKQDSR